MNKRSAYSCGTPNRVRFGFTLIEILAVIAIIGLIAAATLVALGGARGFFSSVTAKSRLDDVAQCLEMYKQKFGEYPPDCCATKAEIRKHILKRWPRTLKSGGVDEMVELAFSETADESTEPGVAPLFWLAGVPDRGSDGQVAYEGFLADEENPFGIGLSDSALDKEPRETPLIELTFDSDGSQGGNYNSQGLIFRAQPIVYFRSGYEGKDKHVNNYGIAAPYMDGGKWYNADSYQLVLPGEDANFGGREEEHEEHEHGHTEESRDLSDPDSCSVYDWDNITNFSDGATLESERE